MAAGLTPLDLGSFFGGAACKLYLFALEMKQVMSGYSSIHNILDLLFIECDCRATGLVLILNL